MNKMKWEIIAAAFICVLLMVSVSADGYSTENDPLVTLSYVEKIKEQILKELLNEIDNEYKVLEVFKGQTITAKNSCEIIFRSGTAKVVVTDEINLANSIGLSDITAGTELLKDADLPVNHCVIIPRGDGRGITITSDIAYLLIRGEYEIAK